jgi:hypothetical protein
MQIASQLPDDWEDALVVLRHARTLVCFLKGNQCGAFTEDAACAGEVLDFPAGARRGGDVIG